MTQDAAPTIDIDTRERATIEGLLRRHLPGVEVWAYGSRVRWNARPQSDLDLVAFASPERRGAVLQLREAFEGSSLPFSVDLLIWDDLPESFHRNIKAEYVVLQKRANQSAMGSWREMPFIEAVLVNPPVSLERGISYPFVDMAAVNGDSRNVQPSVHREFKGGGSKFQSGDTLMARITPCLENGKIARYQATEGQQEAHGSTEFIVVRGRPDITDNAFAYYLIRWKEVRNYAIGQMTGTSGRQRVPVDSLDHLAVPLPPLPEQRAIAHVLGTLDDKIELNRRMNRTLEEMARAIFRDWFVDFGPVRAKLEGREPYLPPELWGLFPDQLEDSELGEIPAGWEVRELGDELAELVSGARPRGGAVTEGVPSIGAENVNGIGQHDYSKEKYVPTDFMERMKSKGAQVRDGDVFLYKDGAQVGRKSYVDCGYPHSVCAVNEHVFILRMRDAVAQRYLFFWLDQDWMTSEIVSLNSNSAQPGINQVGVRSLPFVLPSSTILHTFAEIAGQLTDKIFANCHESRTLAAQRDALLPKLLSGELRFIEG